MSGKKNKPLTRKQADLVRLVAEGHTQTEAYKMVYGTKKDRTARVDASKTLAKPNVRMALMVALEKHGITADSIVKPVKDALEAKKQNQFTGEITPDHSVRLKAAGMAASFYGIKQGGDININFNAVAQKDKDEFGL